MENKSLLLLTLVFVISAIQNFEARNCSKKNNKSCSEKSNGKCCKSKCSKGCKKKCNQGSCEI